MSHEGIWRSNHLNQSLLSITMQEIRHCAFFICQKLNHVNFISYRICTITLLLLFSTSVSVYRMVDVFLLHYVHAGHYQYWFVLSVYKITLNLCQKRLRARLITPDYHILVSYASPLPSSDVNETLRQSPTISYFSMRKGLTQIEMMLVRNVSHCPIFRWTHCVQIYDIL